MLQWYIRALAYSFVIIRITTMVFLVTLLGVPLRSDDVKKYQ
jgi:hypothetical protein